MSYVISVNKYFMKETEFTKILLVQSAEYENEFEIWFDSQASFPDEEHCFYLLGWIEKSLVADKNTESDFFRKWLHEQKILFEEEDLKNFEFSEINGPIGYQIIALVEPLVFNFIIKDTFIRKDKTLLKIEVQISDNKTFHTIDTIIVSGIGEIALNFNRLLDEARKQGLVFNSDSIFFTDEDPTEAHLPQYAPMYAASLLLQKALNN